MVKRVAAGVLTIVLAFAGPASPDKAAKDHSEYVFARVEFNMYPDWRLYYREAPWHHDYPKSEDFFLAMVAEVTGVRTSPDAFQIVQADGREVFRYPFLYFSEPGFWDMTDEEMENLREYFNRGGFALFDDFRGRHLNNLQQQMKKIFPAREMIRLDLDHEVFRTFYDIKSLDMTPPYLNVDSGTPAFWGMKDESGRLILVANADNDFGEFWEDIDNGGEALRPAVQSFQFGVNYLIYAMTH